MNFCKIDNQEIKELLKLEKKGVELETMGLSMIPTLDEGSKINVYWVDPDDIKTGDVIECYQLDEIKPVLE